MTPILRDWYDWIDFNIFEALNRLMLQRLSVKNKWRSAIFGYSEYVVCSFKNICEDSSKIIKKSKEKDIVDV